MKKAEIIYGSNLKKKESYIWEEIKNVVSAGDKVLYIVPEQYAFDADKTVLFNLGERFSHLTETINFKRMAANVNNKFTPTKKGYITEEIKNLILYKIYLDNLSSFRALSKRGGTPDTILIFKDILAELKSSTVSSEQLKKVIEALPKDTFLYNKLCDLKLILDEYEKYLLENYRDFDDGFNLLSYNIRKYGLYKDYHIFIDNFVHFSESELLIIKALFKNAKSVHFVLLGNDFSAMDEGDLFFLTKNTVASVNEIASDAGFFVSMTRCDEADEKQLENIFSDKECVASAENIVMLEAKSQTDEVRETVLKIKQLIKNGASYNDIAVFSGDMSPYSHIIEAQFRAAEIPYFDDKKEALIKSPVSRIFISAFELYTNDFSLNELILYLNSLFFLAADKDKVRLFEKVATSLRMERECITDYEKWDTTLSTALMGNDYFILRKEDFNDVYKNMIMPVIEAFSGLERKNTAYTYEKCFSLLIKKLNLQKMLKLYAENMADVEKARALIASYNIFLSCIKNISVINKEAMLSCDEYFTLLKQSVGVYKTGSLPNSMDSVLVSTVDRGRSEGKDYVFVLGMNDGITPKTNESTGFLSDNDRKLIQSITKLMLPTAVWKNNSSLLSLYRICNMAGKTLYISKSSFSSDGTELSESYMWSRFFRFVGKIEEASPLYVNRSEAVSVAVSKCGESSEFYRYVENENKQLFSDFGKMKSEDYFSVYKTVSKKLLDSKFNKKLNTSVSRLETYRKCGYSYFLRYLLKVDEPENASFDFAKSGTLIHNIIDKFSKKLAKENISWENATEDYIDTTLKSVVYSEIAENFSKINMFNPRVKYMAGKLQRTAKTAILYIKEHMTKGSFVPLGYEIPIGSDGVKPISIALSDGAVVEIYGRIDRADGFFDKKSNTLYIRIVDYKSSHKSIDFSLVKEGIQLQLLTYLHTLVKNGHEYLNIGGEILPGAAMYMACDSSMSRFYEKPAPEELRRTIAEKFMLSGIILNDDDVISAIDKEISEDNPKYNTVVADITKNKGDGFNIKNLLYREQFKELLSDSEKLIAQTGQKIIDGEFYIKPYYFGGKNACEWCVYKSICNFDNTVNSYRYIPKVSKDEYFEMQ